MHRKNFRKAYSPYSIYSPLLKLLWKDLKIDTCEMYRYLQPRVYLFLLRHCKPVTVMCYPKENIHSHSKSTVNQKMSYAMHFWFQKWFNQVWVKNNRINFDPKNDKIIFDTENAGHITFFSLQCKQIEKNFKQVWLENKLWKAYSAAYNTALYCILLGQKFDSAKNRTCLHYLAYSVSLTPLYCHKL